MRSPFRALIPLPARGITAGVLAVCHLVLACGVPLPAPRSVRKDTSRPYPCQDRPCGCGTYEECWAGDCCCFTLAEKVAWAHANGVVPPVAAPEPACAGEDACEHCHPKPKTEPTDTCPSCEKPAAAADEPRWVIPSFAQKCHGSHADNFAHLPPAVPPEPISPPVAGERDPFHLPASVGASARADAPTSPPPRFA